MVKPNGLFCGGLWWIPVVLSVTIGFMGSGPALGLEDTPTPTLTLVPSPTATPTVDITPTPTDDEPPWESKMWGNAHGTIYDASDGLSHTIAGATIAITMYGFNVFPPEHYTVYSKSDGTWDFSIYAHDTNTLYAVVSAPGYLTSESVVLGSVMWLHFQENKIGLVRGIDPTPTPTPSPTATPTPTEVPAGIEPGHTWLYE